MFFVTGVALSACSKVIKSDTDIVMSACPWT